MHNTWTIERVDRLRILAKSGLSMREIGGEMGLPRSAIIGKMHRLGLSTVRPAPLPAEERAARLAKRRRIDAEAKRIRREAAQPTGRIYLAGNGNVRPVYEIAKQPGLRDAEVEPLHLSLPDLKAHNCRYPYGEGPFTFCGQPIRDGSYCFAHAALCAGVGRGPYNVRNKVSRFGAEWV